MDRIIFLATIALVSCYPQLVSGKSTRAVVLHPQWDQSKTSNTYFIHYQLANRSKGTIFPTRDNFSGLLERWDGERWQYVVGGVSCTSGMQWTPLDPGKHVDSPLLFTHPMILPKGRYRFRVEYSRSPYASLGHATLSVSSEFEIDSSNRRTTTTERNNPAIAPSS